MGDMAGRSAGMAQFFDTTSAIYASLQAILTGLPCPRTGHRLRGADRIAATKSKPGFSEGLWPELVVSGRGKMTLHRAASRLFRRRRFQRFHSGG